MGHICLLGTASRILELEWTLPPSFPVPRGLLQGNDFVSQQLLKTEFHKDTTAQKAM